MSYPFNTYVPGSGSKWPEGSKVLSHIKSGQDPRGSNEDLQGPLCGFPHLYGKKIVAS